jgi:hypothetical protein
MARRLRRFGMLALALTTQVAVAAAAPPGRRHPDTAAVAALQPVARATLALALPMSTEPPVDAPRPPLDVTPPSALERALGGLLLDVGLPGLPQYGDVNNCGPTAAAMLLAGYQGTQTRAELEALREAIGYWSWDMFPLRQLSLPGFDAGMTTPGMLRATLEHFADDVAFAPIGHPWLPAEVWSVATLKRALAERRPILALVQSATLWNVRTAGLHWVVVRGIEDGVVIYNDPADGTRSEVAFDRFWRAWRLSDLYRSLPMVGPFQALAPDVPVPERSLMEDAGDAFLPVAR